MSDWTDDFGNTVHKIHDPARCEGQPCPIHHPSDHLMTGFPQLWRWDWGGFMERICPHGVGHPDPDCIRAKDHNQIHGCDGCCHEAPLKQGSK